MEGDQDVGWIRITFEFKTHLNSNTNQPIPILKGDKKRLMGMENSLVELRSTMRKGMEIRRWRREKV